MSDLGGISLILSIIALGISFLHLLLEYFSKLKTQAPTIKISATDLPPYIDNKAKTHIIIENVGTAIARNPELSIEHSYTDGDMYIQLQEDYLTLNVRIEIKERLVEPPSGTHKIKFHVEVGRSKRRRSRNTFTKAIEIVVD